MGYDYVAILTDGLGTGGEGRTAALLGLTHPLLPYAKLQDIKV